jgi:predicted aconitase with swiveling domain
VARGTVLVAGEARAAALRLDEPLSFWGGLDPANGRIVDRHHPQHGAVVAGRVLVMARTRGSTASAGTLAEAVRCGAGPAALVLGEPDVAVVMGLLVAAELYGSAVPVAVLGADDLSDLPDGREVAITAEGEVVVAG